MASTKQHHYGNVSPLPHSPASLPSPNSQLFRQLRHDIAKLSDRDPDTRRSSLESLKGFIEEQLDARNIPNFVDQVSSDRGTGAGAGGVNGGGGTFAISLFVEVARVHKQNTIPFIPRIMSSIIRSLSTSSANSMNNLHQACSKVITAVARYAIDTPPSSASALSSCAEVLYGVAQPLLGQLFSNIEPVAVGSAICLQALIEAENWKYATPELVSDVCYKSSVCLVEKCKLTVAHLGLVKSLAKFNSAGLQDYASSLLKIAISVLSMKPVTGSGTPQRQTASSWQQRVSAAQLVAAILSSLDPRILASELVSTTQALEGCKFDKNATVRQAVVEALNVAKSLTPQLDPLLLQDNGFDDPLVLSTPPRSRPPDPRRRSNRKKNLWRSEESSGSTSSFDDLVVGSQESHMFSYSPGSVTTLSMNSPAGSTACSAVKIGRSPLYPAKQSPIIPSSVDRYNADSELHFLLSHAKSLDSKENAPFVSKPVDVILSAKSEELGLGLFNNVNKLSKDMGINNDLTGNVANQNCNAENERNSFLFELIGDTKQILDDGLCKENLPSSEDWLSSKSLDDICERELCHNDGEIEDVIIKSNLQSFSNEDETILDNHQNVIEQRQNVLDKSQNLLDQEQKKNVSYHQSPADLSENVDFETKRNNVSTHHSVADMSDHMDCVTRRNGLTAHQSLADISDNLEFVAKRNGVSAHQSLADISDCVNLGNGEEKNLDSDSQTCITSITTVDNSHQEDASSQQVAKKRLTSEDFLIFSTPRRLVRRLQSVTSTPDSRCVVDNQAVDFDFETLSESGWSVRDNPIAGRETEDDSPRDNSVVLKSMESPLLKRSYSQGSTITDDKNFTFSASADNIDSSLRASFRTDFSRNQLDVFGFDRDHDEGMNMEDDNCFDCMGDYNITSVELSEVSLLPKQLFGSTLSEMSQLTWTNFGRKVQRCAEMSLIVALLFVLLFTAMVAVLNSISGQDDDLHTLVPT